MADTGGAVELAEVSVVHPDGGTNGKAAASPPTTMEKQSTNDKLACKLSMLRNVRKARAHGVQTPCVD